MKVVLSKAAGQGPRERPGGEERGAGNRGVRYRPELRGHPQELPIPNVY